ncbi:sulfur carrier protein ThiS adenylyltransferase ThiF [Cetobacterium sp.]|uniref:sulfur carrier protein ThiS adenylyltransferase ThiF n=1 Tax=Cetobacterium sp. TaxID=2071632 RepID=UPI0025C55ACE|nr:sulfur carrier protein ThiS adenylyltransferase ThiF [Cetobacterium sp.]
MIKIGVAGCGGIGSNVAMNLVRAGIKNFILVDFDKIEESNLNRQFYFKNQIGLYKAPILMKNLKSINENLNIDFFVEKIDKNNILDFFSDCDIIIEAFDKKEFKTLLIENYSTKYIISANGIGGRDLKNIKNLTFNKLTVIGDFYSDIKIYQTYSTKVMFIACLMANKVLDIIGGFSDEKI